MKSIKRNTELQFLQLVLLSLACSGAAKSDNGTYVYEASKDFIKNTLTKQGVKKKQKNTLTEK